MTLHEIAKRANVSTATVSRTINCAPNVTPSVARRVRKMIEEAGYYPNTHARALVSRHSCIFGLMVSDAFGPFPCHSRKLRRKLTQERRGSLATG